MSASLRKQVSDYQLAFTCEDCKYFEAPTEQCTIYYPAHLHKNSTIEALADGERLYFCKMFESDR